MSEAPSDKPGRIVRLVSPPLEHTIRVIAGKRHIAADQGIQAMFEAGVAFFQRDKQLVRCTIAKAKASDGAIIEVPAIVQVTPAIIARELGKAATWEKFNSKNKLVTIDPPKEVVEQIAAMQGEWPFPPLAGVTGTPTLRPDGSILSEPGYDPETGLFLISPPTMPPIPEHPTFQDASNALATLSDLLSEFPFVVEHGGIELSKSVAISMLMTAVLRGGLIPAVPMHVVTAPHPGSGKSYLADIAAAIATGDRCPVVAAAPTPEETEKRLVGSALSGFPLISLDNVNDILTGDFLAQITERPILQVRALGSSTMIRLSNNFTLFANGNNITATADMVRRTIRCALDPDAENPEERQFAHDPVATVLADRGKYVAACLIIARAYIVAGLPNRRPRLPSFGPWSDLVRSPLVWLGWADPVASMDISRADDPSRQKRTALFDAWEEELQTGASYRSAELIELANQYTQDQFTRPNLRASLSAICGDKKGGGLSVERLGKWLGSNANTRSGNLKLVVDRADIKRPKWVLNLITTP